DSGHKIRTLRSARLPSAGEVDHRNGYDLPVADDGIGIVGAVLRVQVENVVARDLHVDRKRAVVVLETCDLPVAENSIEEAVAAEPEAPVLARGYLPDGVHCDHMPLVGGIVAAFLGEAEIVLGCGGLVRSGGCADAVPPCIACRSVEASGEPPVPAQAQGIVGAAAAARFDIHLGVAVAEL